MKQQKNHTRYTYEPSSRSFDKIAKLPRSKDLLPVSKYLGKIEIEDSWPGLSTPEPPPTSTGFLLGKSSSLLISPALAGIVLTLQQKTVVGVRTTESFISAKTRNQGVFFCAIPYMVAQAGHPKGGRVLMRPVVLTPSGLPPLRLEPQAVAALTRQELMS